MGDSTSDSIGGDAVLSAQGLHGLFTISMLMFASTDGAEIVRLCASSFPALGSLRAVAGYLNGPDGLVPVDVGNDSSAGLAERVSQTGVEGGPISLDGWAWGWVMPLLSLSGCRGYLTMAGPAEPQKYEYFLLDALIRQAGAALENAALHQDLARYSASLRAMNQERGAATEQLRTAVDDLERRARVHETLAQVSATPDLTAALVEALGDLTGLDGAVEDAFGNVEYRSAPKGPGRYEPMSGPDRDEVARAAMARAGRAVRVKGRLVALARPGHETLGAVVLLDPERAAGEYEAFVLERAAGILGTDLLRRRSVIELELRLRRQLVDELISGSADADNAAVRAAATGHDLTCPHRAVVVHWSGLPDEELLTKSVERVTAKLGLEALIARRDGNVVLLVAGELSGEVFYDRICGELHSVTGSIGIGGVATTPRLLPKSFEEALHALEIRTTSRTRHGATSFEELGIYRILATGQSGGEVNAYVNEWLGPLLDYDAKHHAVLVETLAEYLDNGGNYDLTAKALLIHRSTLRYRLRRIREMTGIDLTDVESRLNLHIATRAWRIFDGT
jgi:hypothetical protein